MWTIPNILSLIRILSIPFFITFILTERFMAGLILLVAAGLTDTLDGQIARRFKQESKMGGYLDPAADKLLGVSIYVTFSLKGLVPAWLAALVFTRDIAISLGALILVLLDMKVIAKPSYLGKATTAFQVGTVALALLGAFESIRPYLHDTGILTFLFIFTGLMTILSGTDYLVRSLKKYEDRLFVKAEKE